MAARCAGPIPSPISTITLVPAGVAAELGSLPRASQNAAASATTLAATTATLARWELVSG